MRSTGEWSLGATCKASILRETHLIIGLMDVNDTIELLLVFDLLHYSRDGVELTHVLSVGLRGGSLAHHTMSDFCVFAFVGG